MRKLMDPAHMRGMIARNIVNVNVVSVVIAYAAIFSPCCFSADQHLLAFDVETSSGDWHGYKDAAGHVVLGPKYRMAQDFTACGIGAVVDPTQGWIYIDGHGQKVIAPLVVDNGPDYFVEGLARYQSQQKVGFMDECGKIIVPAEYDFASPFEKGYSVVSRGCQMVPAGEYHVCKGGQWGLIDKKARIVIPIKYDDYSFGEKKFRMGEAWQSADSLLRVK